MLKRLMFASSALLLCGLTAVAGNLSFNGTTDKPKAVYEPGEKMVFSIQTLDDGKPVEGKKLKWIREGDDGKKDGGEAVSAADKPLVIETSTDNPGFVHIIVQVLGDDGKQLRNEKNQPVQFDGGAGVLLEKLEGYPEPKDFDAFWARQKEKLAAVPLKVLEKVEVASKNPAFTVYDVKIACAGNRPVSGYLSIPKDAKEKSLPARVTFIGYSICGSTQAFSNGAITFNVNAHGIENGKDPDYYKQLADGELRSYALIASANSDPETCYFNGMMLRLMRALEFVKTLPEWNGKDLEVSGGSQGGLQSLVAAGLDSDVTKCSVAKPWCCDLEGIKLGRLKALFRPEPCDAVLGYYDAANHAKRIKCETIMTSGLGDYVCPPSGITVLYNNIKAPKTITYSQGCTHGYNMPNAQTFSISSK